MTAALTLNFRRPELTSRCVRTLLADGWAPVLIWDNSGDDGASAEALRVDFATSPEVHVVVCESNVGFAAGVNRGLKWLADRGADTPVLVINNDTEVCIGARQYLLETLQSTPRTAVVAPEVVQGGESVRWMYYVPALAIVSSHPIRGALPYLSGCCLLIDTSRISEPILDEKFFMYGEDVALSWRLRGEGLALAVDPRAKVNHVGSASSGGGTSFYEDQLIRAHLRLSEILGVRSRGLKPIWFISLCARALLRSIRFRNTSPLHALRLVFHQ